MKNLVLRAGVVAGIASIAVLAAGPAATAADPVSQATANGINLEIAGNKVVSDTTHATNDGTKQTKTTTNTSPSGTGVVPGSNVAGLGVVLQDAFAHSDGNSSACAGLTGQGGGIVQVGDKPCSIDGGQATTVDLATLNLGDKVANPNSILDQVTTALGLTGTTTQIQDSLVGPLTKALSDALGNAGLTGSLGVVAGMCTANPDSATGKATIANSHIGLTLGGQTVTLVDLPADPDPNTHVLTDLSKVTSVLLNAVTTDVTNALNNPSGAAGTSPLGQLGTALSQLGPVTAILGTTVVKQITDTVQSQVLTQVSKALQPLLAALQDNVLDITLNKQPVPQKAKTFETTALDLQVLSALKQFTGGASLVGGTIGHVVCGPNSRAAAPPTASPTTPTEPTASPTTPNNVPTNVDSGVGGDSHANEILAAAAALLALAGVGGTAAYRRYGMPRG